MAAPNLFQNTSSSNPAPTGSTAPLMSGVGQANSFTPRGSGTVRVSVTGNCGGSLASSGGTLQLVAGVGNPPAAIAALTGTPVGRQLTFTAPASAGLVAPFAFDAIIYGLNPNTSYWFDLAYAGNGTGSFGPSNITITALEL